MRLYKLTVFFITLLLSQYAFSAQQVNTKAEKLKFASVEEINHLISIDKETLSYDEVTTLASRIILNRQQYSNDTVAKAFILLADIAINRSELDRAFQFAEDGLMLKVNNSQLKLCLLLRLAAVYSTKSKYENLLSVTEQAYALANKKEKIKYALLALSYRSVAFALLSKHQKALADLQQVEKLMSENPKFAQHIELLSILASAHNYLGDYHTALTIQLKILKIRFDSNKKGNIDKTYFQLAKAYENLYQLDDAYSAYSEAKKYAQKKSADISSAYISQGLGNILLQRKKYKEAIQELTQAKDAFEGKNLTKPYLETLTALAQIYIEQGREKRANQLLLKAEALSENIHIEYEQQALFPLLIDMYVKKGDIDRAYNWQRKYIEFLSHERKSNAPFFMKNQYNNGNSQPAVVSEQAKRLVINLAEKSELSMSFSTKYFRQKMIIYGLFALCVIFVMALILQWFRYRNQIRNLTYEDVEQPNKVIASPIKTKLFYQLAFKKARKHEYPLTVGYLTIINWEELTFRFSKNIIVEVTKDIVSLINEHLGEFDQGGMLQDGEYILLYPHQNINEAREKINQLEAALKLRLFANLGEFSINIDFALKQPNFQDIDPYIFLSQFYDSFNSSSTR